MALFNDRQDKLMFYGARYIVIAWCLVMLVSCSRTVTNTAMLPDLVAYSAETRAAAAAEIEANTSPVLIEFAKDYHVMRNQVRVAKGEKVPLPK